MSEDQNARDLLDRAEQAAMADDLASADELLQDAARLQEEALGPLHPDLANTLNNLAVVAERTGRPDEAEALYRRAAAIAAAALPADHPMVAASRQNLEDFCRARGMPIDAPVVVGPTEDTNPDVDPSGSGHPPEAAEPPAAVLPAPIPYQPLPPVPTPGGRSHSLAWGAVVVVVLLAVGLARSWSSRDAPKPAPTPAPTAAPPAARPTEAVPPPTGAPPARSAPTAQGGPPKAPPRGDDRSIAADKPPAPGDITVASAQLCRTFSASGGVWRCDPVADSVAPGAITFYTRVRSPRDATVEHRWYRGAALRQSVRLRIRFNTTEGYRTYSRQTVNDGDWRVEVRSADGSLLHERQFAVR